MTSDRLCAVVICVLAVTYPSAQADESSAPTNHGSGVQDLVILARVPNSVFPNQLAQNFEDAIVFANVELARQANLNGTERVEIRHNQEVFEVTSISTAEYEVMKLLIENTDAFVDEDRTPPLEPYQGGQNEWKVHQKNPHEKLAGITLKYVANGEEKTEFFPTQTLNDVNPRFYGTETLGDYIVRLDANWDLKEYSLDKVVFEPWPIPDRKYLLRFREFRGGTTGQSALFDAMGTKVVNKLVNVSNVRPGLFTIANLNELVTSANSGWTENKFTVRFGRLGRGLKADKVWMLFPLSEGERDAALARLAAGDGSQNPFTSKTLAEAVAEERLKHSNGTPESNGQTVLSPMAEPTWQQLNLVTGTDSADVLGYSHTFDVQDISGWIARTQDKPVYAITLYEQNEVVGPRIIPLKSRDNGKESLWNVQEISEWPAGLKKYFEAKNVP